MTSAPDTISLAPPHAARRLDGSAIVAAVLTVILLAAIVLIELGSPAKDAQFNADSTYLILLMDDLVLHRGRLADWFLAPHYYFFPDGLLSLLILGAQRIGIAPFVGSVVVYGGSWITVGALVWRRLTGRSYLQSMPWVALAMALGLAAFYAMYLATHGSEIETIAQGQALFPALHAGSAMAAIISFELLLLPLAAARWSLRHWLAFATLLVLVAPVTFSDVTFVAWGIAPLLAVMASRWRHATVQRLLLMALAVLVAAGVGFLASVATGDAVREHYLDVLRNDVSATGSGTEALEYFWRAARVSSSPRSVIFYTNIVLWIIAAVAFWREFAGARTQPRNRMLILLGAMSFLSVAAPIASGIFAGYMVRILVPYLLLGNLLFFGVLLASAERLLRGRMANAILATGACVAIAAGAWLYASSSPLGAKTLASCLSARNLKSGAASYWEATPVMLETGHRIHVVPLLHTDLRPFQWMTKRQWLSHDMDGEPVALQFVIARDAPAMLPESKVRAVFGPPQNEFRCADWTILLYTPAKSVPPAQ